MSNPIPATPTPTGEFQAHVGGPPSSIDLAAECKKWENLCGELLGERQKLREELAKTQGERDRYLEAVYHFMGKDYQPPTFTKEEALALVDQAPSLEEFIAELESAMRTGA